jgi:hypothetical protein
MITFSRVGVTTAVFLFAVLLASPSRAGQGASQTAAAPTLAGDLQKDWTALKDTLVKLGGAMPAEKFSFKPKPELRTFAEQLMHVATANVNFLRGIDPKITPPTLPEKAAGKDEVLKALSDSFEFGSAVLKAQTDATLAKNVEGAPRFLGPSTGARLVYRAMGHTWDEYGVMTVYLRLNDIVPPASQR